MNLFQRLRRGPETITFGGPGHDGLRAELTAERIEARRLSQLAVDATSERDAVLAQLDAAQAEIAALGKESRHEQWIAAGARQDVQRVERANAMLVAELAAARADLVDAVAPVTAPPVVVECVCGGDTELHLRGLLVSAEVRALRDRANTNVMADRLAAAEGRPVIGSLT